MTPMLGIMASQISGKLFTLAGNYDALSTVTVPSGGLSSITFAGIPQTGYSHLQLRITGTATTNADGLVYFNSDTTNANYRRHYLQGNGSSAGSGTDASLPAFDTANLTTGQYGVWIVDILDYTNTNKNTTVRTAFGYDANGSGYVGITSILWSNTAAINALSIQSRTWNQYSSFALYGVK